MSRSDTKPVVIVGAGVTGLSLGCFLVEEGLPVVVIEQADRPGGLAKSFQYDGFTFDIGPHRFHTDVKNVDRFVREVLAEDVRRIKRRSQVHFQDRFYPWPLHPSYVLLRFPPRIGLGILLDLFRLFRSRKPVTFKDQIVNMYGRTLYEHFFRSYSSKFLGITPELTHPNWAKTGIDRAIIDERLQIDTLFKLLLSLVVPSGNPDLEFVYSDGGCGRFIERLAARFERAGGALLCGRAVDALEHDGTGVRRVIVGDRQFEPSTVVWTGTVHSLTRSLGMEDPDLRYLALVCYNMMLSEGEHFPFQWSYHGDPDILFSRVSVPANFDANNTPPGFRSICVEVSCSEDDRLFAEPEAYVERLLVDMKRQGLLATDHEVIGVHAERVKWAYPIYHIDYLKELAKLDDRLAPLRNLIRAGRLGQFWYNNMDQCVAASMDIAAKIVQEWGGSTV